MKNHAGEILTVQRSIAGEKNRKLVSTWMGPLLTESVTPGTGRDFFIHDSGSATREAGFHTFLAEFIGWKLPLVPRFNGTECPLYIETILPLMFVEQKQGCGGIQANLPTFFGIREVGKRTIEFLLKMGAPEVALERQRIEADIAAVRQRWSASRESLIQEIAIIGGNVEYTLRKMDQAEERFHLWLGRLESISTEWKAVQMRKSELPADVLVPSDRQKLQALQSAFIAQLKQYQFKSVTPDSITISEETYRPNRDGFNLGFDLSASDNIRLIWAYLTALLEVSRSFNTNHLGLLVFDEPRQQDAARVSFEELLRRASSARQFGQQVIFSTSGNLQDLQKTLAGIPHTLLSLEGKVFKPLSP